MELDTTWEPVGCSWDARNNSGNISGILYNYLQSPNSLVAQPYVSSKQSKPLVVSNTRNITCDPGWCRECYCRNVPVYPRLGLQLPVVSSTTTSVSIGQTRPLNFKRKIKHKSSGVYKPLELPLPQVQDMEHNEEQTQVNSSKNIDEPNGQPLTKEENPSCKSTNALDSYLTKLKDFRSQNYFDCHSVNKDNNETESHSCIHQFTIDDRLFPVALNPDPFGISKCTICNTSMKSPHVPQKNDFVTRQKTKDSASMPTLTRTNVYHCQDTVIFKVPTDSNISKDICSYNANKRRIVPVSSLALRHQKFQR